MQLMQAKVVTSLPCIVSIQDTPYCSTISKYYVELCDTLCLNMRYSNIYIILLILLYPNAIYYYS